MPNGWGGRRPGNGHQSKEDVLYVESHRRTVRRLCDPAFEDLITTYLTKARNGDLDSFKYLMSYICPPPPPQSSLDVFHHDDPPPVTWDRLPWQDPIWLAQRAQRILAEANRLHLIDGSSRVLDEDVVDPPPPADS